MRASDAKTIAMKYAGADNAFAAGEVQQLERDINFDVLKIIGLFCVIIAHTDPPESVLYFQSFDVTLMVIISGALFSYSSSRTMIAASWTYIKQRLLRLIVPTWTFLVFFFIVTYLVYSASGKQYPFSGRQIMDNFALLHGYVWIIRVFMLVAVISPLLLRMRTSLSNRRYFMLLLTAYLSYEIMYRLF